jgi:GNAT superfamily N-acetyltransferase
MQSGEDFAILLGSTQQALCRVDDHGWLALSGEASADLNMVFVSRSCPSDVLDRYIDEVERRHLDAILMVDEGAPHLAEGAVARGLTSAGQVPVMVWHGTSLPDTAAGSHLVRLAAASDIHEVNAAMAEAFSLNEEAVQRSMPPSLVSSGADIWILEAEGTIAGSGAFVRSGDHVGIYCMATRPQFQRQGIGRAVLNTAMRYYLDHEVTTFTLEATAAGVRLYEQVGFKTVAQPSVFVIGSSTQFST